MLRGWLQLSGRVVKDYGRVLGHRYTPGTSNTRNKQTKIFTLVLKIQLHPLKHKILSTWAKRDYVYIKSFNTPFFGYVTVTAYILHLEILLQLCIIFCFPPYNSVFNMKQNSLKIL